MFIARVAARWPQIESICDRAEHLVDIAASRGLLPLDHIVSGLPFASLPAASARAIVDAIVASLRPGGTFTTFQYVHAFGFPSAVVGPADAQLHAWVRSPTRQLVLGNLPPALVVRWTKGVRAATDSVRPQRDLA